MTLDPKNWDEFRKTAHALLDHSIDKMQNASQGTVWQPVPETQKQAIEVALPSVGASDAAVADMLQGIMPYGVGNTHPRFFGWVNGAGAPSGVLSEIAAAAMNVNSGGRNHVSPVVECQVVRWSAQMMGMPPETSGIVVTGTSTATYIALKVARDAAVDHARAKGVPQGQLIGYTSAQTHACVAQAYDLLGLGRDNLRQIACNDALEIDLAALSVAITKDRAAGLTPFMIVGTAGAVNMGAIDDLEGLADIAQAEDMWFHIDGAFGATAVIGQHAKQRLTGLARADSIAFDYHKWLQVNYDAGCVLIRDEAAHRNSFADRPDYLRGTARGLAGGAFWATDFGPELSRGFRALKVWAHFLHHGTDALAAVIDRNIEQAQYLEARVNSEPDLEMLAPVPLNICCFRFRAADGDLNALNDEIVIQLQESGIAVPSTTIFDGKLAIRVNLTNHRTQNSDLDMLVEAVLKIGRGLAG